MSEIPIICPNCGAKLRAGRDRCPRCRARLAAAETVRDPKQSQRLMAITAVIILIFVAILLFLWYSSPATA